MRRALFVLTLALSPLSAQEYWHRLSGAFGALNPINGGQITGYGTSPMLSFDYGYRFHRFSQADLGVDIGFATQKNGPGADTRRNIYLPRFGYRGVIPIWQNRIEASLGAGGAHSYIKPTEQGKEVWLVYGLVGANYAIDSEKRYRAGLNIRWYRDPIGTPVQQYISVGAEFTYSFGQ